MFPSMPEEHMMLHFSHQNIISQNCQLEAVWTIVDQIRKKKVVSSREQMEQTGDFPKKRTQIHTQGPPSSCREITAISHYMSSTSWSRPEAIVALIIIMFSVKNIEYYIKPYLSCLWVTVFLAKWSHFVFIMTGSFHNAKYNVRK